VEGVRSDRGKGRGGYRWTVLVGNCGRGRRVASANASESRERTWSVGIVILAGALVAYGVAGLALYELVTFL